MLPPALATSMQRVRDQKRTGCEDIEVFSDDGSGPEFQEIFTAHMGPDDSDTESDDMAKNEQPVHAYQLNRYFYLERG